MDQVGVTEEGILILADEVGLASLVQDVLVQVKCHRQIALEVLEVRQVELVLRDEGAYVLNALNHVLQRGLDHSTDLWTHLLDLLRALVVSCDEREVLERAYLGQETQAHLQILELGVLHQQFSPLDHEPRVGVVGE